MGRVPAWGRLLGEEGDLGQPRGGLWPWGVQSLKQGLGPAVGLSQLGGFRAWEGVVEQRGIHSLWGEEFRTRSGKVLGLGGDYRFNACMAALGFKGKGSWSGVSGSRRGITAWMG